VTKTFLFDLVERALRVFAAALLGAFSAGLTVANIQWGAALNIAGTAAMVSILTSLSSVPISGGSTASLLRATTPAGRHEAQ
jgi:hypothetical protein